MMITMYVAPTESEEREAAAADPQQWIDALSTGALTQDEFVGQVISHEAEDPEIGWAVLALLDQNFRRKRIPRETFLALKSRLQRHSLGAQGYAKPAVKRKPRTAPSGPPEAARPASVSPPAAPGDARLERPAVGVNPAAPAGSMAPAEPGPAAAGPVGTTAAIATADPIRTAEPRGPGDRGRPADPVSAADPGRPADPARTAEDSAATRTGTAASEPMTARGRNEPAPVLRMHALPEPAPAAERELLDASFHREVRVGDLLCGRYRVVDILRRIDWMTLVEAIDETKAAMPGVRQRVALQVLDEELSQDPLVLQRIGKLQSLSHPAITRTLDVEDDSGALVLVTEFHGGVSLRDLLERRADRRVPLQSALAIVRALAGALAHAHACGVAHGELTAANVLITELGDARLQGFGLRAQSHAVQPAADRMAFARLAYELLSGTEPVQALTPASLSKLRAPPGTTRAQWRALRDTLSGRDPQDASVLAVFGGEAPAPAEPVLLQDGGEAAPPRRGHLREWLAAGIVALILAGGAYLYLFGDGGSAGGVDAGSADPSAAATAGAATDIPAAPVEGAAAGRADASADGQAAATTLDRPPSGVPAGAATNNAVIPPPAMTTATADGGRTARGPGDPAAAGAGAGAVAGVAAPGVGRTPTVAASEPPAANGARARSSIDLAANHAWVDTTERVARIWVARRGSLNSEVTFRWWTETGTAQADRDFRAIAPRIGVIPEGARGVELLVPLMPDPQRREPRTFYVKIDEPGPGAELGTRTLMQVAIVPPGYPAARDGRAAQNLLPPAALSPPAVAAGAAATP